MGAASPDVAPEEETEMRETDQVDELTGRLQSLEHAEVGQRGMDRRAFLRRTALTGIAAGSASSILAACGKFS